MVVVEKNKITVSSLLADIEENHMGVPKAGSYNPKTTERSRGRILSPEEIQGISHLDHDEKRVMYRKIAVDKLVRAKVFWTSATSRPHEHTNFFQEDTQPGLSPLEEDVIRVQVDSLIHGSGYDSILISAHEIASLANKLKKHGNYSAKLLLHQTLELAAIRDDMQDLESM